jgi:hypothetical protein
VNNPNVTDWITASASVFAAVGTVGAVIVALVQTRATTRRSVAVTCRTAIMALDDGTVDVVSLRATNVAQRPIKLDQAYIETDDGHQVLAKFLQPNAHQTFAEGTLPAVLDDGRSVTVHWRREQLEQIAAAEGVTAYLSALFTDTQGNIYRAAFPGVTTRRKLTWRDGPHRKTIYMPPGRREPPASKYCLKTRTTTDSRCSG